jgi:voltage-gated potassium channel
MIIGYSIIAVPTGIVTAEITQAARRPANTHTCPSCFSEGHAKGARYCRDCGEEFPRGHTLSDQS